MLDGWRLAVGTLTAIRVRPPTAVDQATARWAMLLAPLAVLPLGIAAGVVVWLGHRAGIAPLAVGLLAVAAVAVGNRALHLDGLSDVADGLTASYDRERSLAVMRTGASGPAGTAAVVIVVGLQAVGFAALDPGWRGAVAAGLLVCLARGALAVTCLAGVPGARSDGLGSSYVGVVPVAGCVASWVLVMVVNAWLVASLGGPWWRGALTAAVALLAVALLVRRVVARFGGVTGDVFGAAIEVTLAVLLVGAS